jgi:hypothetical protein
MDEHTHNELRQLEENLWRAETRFDDALMDGVFAADLIEFGRSGRIYARDDMFIGQAGWTEIDAVLPLANISIRTLSRDIVQVTYISEVRYGSKVELANRSSLWRRVDGGWKLCFHQGTPIA